MVMARTIVESRPRRNLKKLGGSRLAVRVRGLLFCSGMTRQQLVPSMAVTILCAALPAVAEDLSPSILTSAACAPIGTAVPSNPPMVLALEANSRMLYYAGDRVMVSAGTKQGVETGQRFFVRRPLSIEGSTRGQQTAGWLRIVDARESSAMAVVDFNCDAIAIGDYLEPFADQDLPGEIDGTDGTGTLDFKSSATVLFGNDGRLLQGDRDFVLSNAGQKHGVTPGTRYAVYHGLMANREPNVSFGEAVVVSGTKKKALLGINEARDAGRGGGTLVARGGARGLGRKGGRGVAAAAPRARRASSASPT